MTVESLVRELLKHPADAEVWTFEAEPKQVTKAEVRSDAVGPFVVLYVDDPTAD